MVITARSISVATGTFFSVGPLVKAVLFAAVSSFLVAFVPSDPASGEPFLNTGAIYSGVFDLASIFTGFLATFYVFIVTKGNAFLERIQSTRTFRMVVTLLKFTILWSAIVIGLSYFMMILNPSGFAVFSLVHAVVFFWLANVFMVAVNFVRCVSQFLTIVETEN